MRTSSYPAPSSEQVEADQFARGSAHSNFASPQSQGDSAVFLDSLSTFEHPHGEKSFLTSNKNFPRAGLCLWPLVLTLGSSDPFLIPPERQLKMGVRSALACSQPSRGLDIIPCMVGMGHWVTPAKVLSAWLLASDLLGVHLAGGGGIIFFHLGISMDVLGNSSNDRFLSKKK